MTFIVTVLGTSSALPTSKRFPSAHLLNADEHFFLIDCGEGTQMQLRKYKCKFARINHIFISHLHGDHIYGLPGLLSSFAMLNRHHDLHIYAFADIEKILSNQFTYAKQPLPFPIIYHPLNSKREELLYENEKISVHSFPLKHSVPCCGFIFREKHRLLNIKKEAIEKYAIPIKNIYAIKKGHDYTLENGTTIANKELTLPPYQPRSYAYCADTMYYEKIIPHIEDCDLLYHESTFLGSDEALAKETKHSTVVHAATIANKAKVNQLLIGHFSSRYKQEAVFLKQARDIFPNTLMAEEGLTITIASKREKKHPPLL